MRAFFVPRIHANHANSWWCTAGLKPPEKDAVVVRPRSGEIRSGKRFGFCENRVGRPSGSSPTVNPAGIVRSSDDLVAETFSISSTAPHLFGGRLPDFEADLRRILAETSPEDAFSVRLPDNELKIWRAVDGGSVPSA
jgi:hypothetical protein